MIDLTELIILILTPLFGSCDVTFDKTAPYPRDALECAGDKKMEDNIFVDEGL
jgi:hypothetical protein